MPFLVFHKKRIKLHLIYAFHNSQHCYCCSFDEVTSNATVVFVEYCDFRYIENTKNNEILTFGFVEIVNIPNFPGFDKIFQFLFLFRSLISTFHLQNLYNLKLYFNLYRSIHLWNSLLSSLNIVLLLCRLRDMMGVLL